jgi:hypothetical protein
MNTRIPANINKVLCEHLPVICAKDVWRLILEGMLVLLDNVRKELETHDTTDFTPGDFSIF